MEAVLVDKIVKLVEGNPGALSVIIEFKGMPEFFLEAVVDYLLDADIKGSQIWTIYKDRFGEDFGAFAEWVLAKMNESGIDTAELAKQAMAQMLVPVGMFD